MKGHERVTKRMTYQRDRVKTYWIVDLPFGFLASCHSRNRLPRHWSIARDAVISG